MDTSERGLERETLTAHLAETLDINRFRDYCPNGLQVEGKPHIRRLVTGVTACLDLLEAAIEVKADAVLVHHGYFWRGEDPRVVGNRRHRLKRLLDHEMNLYAYHLPLDAHATLGNNAQLGARLEFKATGRFGDQDLGWYGDCDTQTVGELVDRVQHVLGRQPTLIGDPAQHIARVAWCTGAAQNAFEQAIDAGASVYLSGEISEQTVHLARESGVAYLACGHHATERFGVQALGDYLSSRFGIDHQFIDIANPV
ncbi:MAG: Nif3-like dinuclear metal center hexameric protein [Oxalobacteraceae bacterium]|nr:Nif3-like dinuclear metal center hexameric protein [Oxalobacteraceae bacterium]